MINIKNIFTNTKGLRIQTMKFKESHRLFFLFLIGIVGGTFLFNILGEELAGKIGIYSEYIISDFKISSIETLSKKDFFLFCMRKYSVQSFFIIFLIALIKGKGICGILCIIKGINISFLVGAATIAYGKGGLLIYIMSIFPHYFLYVPLFIFSIYFGSNVRQLIDNKRLVTGICKGCVVEFGLIFGTALLEAYGNLPIVISMFT